METVNNENSSRIEGRNAVLEAFRAGKTVDKLFVKDGCRDGAVLSILREAKKQSVIINYVSKERLDRMSQTGAHQGVIAQTSEYAYAEIDDMLEKARAAGEPPFLILLDGIEDPHNLGAIIRTADHAGAHGVIITKHRSASVTAAAVKASAGAVNYVLVAKTGSLVNTIERLKKEGLWFVCADMDGTPMYELDLKGPIGLIIGNEGSGVSRLVKESCDMTAAIPMRGSIDSLNASVACGVLSYEIFRQRLMG